MKDRKLVVVLITLALSVMISTAAETPSFAGEYTDKSFLGGKAVFQLSLEQRGNTVSVFFSAIYNDAHGAAPEADGTGKVTGKGIVEFKWNDSFSNTGTGTITRSGDDVVVSIKPAKVMEPRCLPFYGQNMRLRRATKK